VAGELRVSHCLRYFSGILAQRQIFQSKYRE
jgi:hypothetical protein